MLINDKGAQSISITQKKVLQEFELEEQMPENHGERKRVSHLDIEIVSHQIGKKMLVNPYVSGILSP